MSKSKELPEDLAAFRASYAELFGTVPPLPEKKFAFSADVDPDFLRVAETLRARAFYSKSFDQKQTQLMLFGMLLAIESGAARFHAVAARRAGATWEELHTVVELASAVRALGPLNQGSAMLEELRSAEPQGGG